MINVEKHFGEFLNTRFSGEKFRNFILKEIAVENRVRLDFSSVKSISQSFADEAFGRLVEEIGFGDFKNKVKIMDLGDESISVIKYVIAQRLKKDNKARI